MPVRSSSKLKGADSASKRLAAAPALHQPFARLFQFGAEGRVGDRDKRTDSFSERAAAQFRDAVLGDHEVGLGARRRDDPVGQLGDDARTGAFAARCASRAVRSRRRALSASLSGAPWVGPDAEGPARASHRRALAYLVARTAASACLKA